MIYEAVDRWNYPYLEHHGVKGMKWGVRKKLSEYVQNRNDAYRSKMLKKTGDSHYKTASNADIQRERRTKLIRNVLAAAAITAAVGLTAYAITKRGQEYSDTILKSGAELKVVARNSDRKFNRAFYATDSAKDAIKYRGMTAVEQMGGLNGKDVFSYSLKNNGGDIKIAGKREAKKVFDDLMKNDEQFAAAAEFNIAKGKLWFAQNGVINGIFADKYDTFNSQLSDHSATQQWATDKFYKALAKKGYGGVRDANDFKFSGYNSKRAIIYFNKLSNFKIDNIQKLDKASMASDYGKAYAAKFAEDAIPASLVVGGGVATGGAVYANGKVKRNDLHSNR